MTTLEAIALETVTGGAPPSTPAAPSGDNAFGRCGPGTAWPILGNIYTPECAAHDRAVRTAEGNGTPSWLAHVEALPLLPAAVGSWINAKLHGR